MTIFEAEVEAEPLKAEYLDKYCAAAASVAEKLRNFLSSHYAKITKATHTPNGVG